jgi:hypothetical protein
MFVILGITILSLLHLPASTPAQAQTSSSAYWRYDASGRLNHVAIADLNLDGIEEFVVVAGETSVVAVGSDGRAQWNTPFQARELVTHITGLNIIDQDDELARHQEIVVATKGQLTLLGFNGERLWERPLDSEPAHILPIPATELLYEKLLERDGRELFLVPVLNYSKLTADPIREMMYHPAAVLGLGDGGAHCGTICDASIQTFMLTHWVRDRTRGERIPLEFAVKRMTKDPARLYGLRDRGTLEVGMKADVNLIDTETLRLAPPEMLYDLPAGGKRFMQRAVGYRATVVSGEVAMERDEPTGSLPGRLVRGA